MALNALSKEILDLRALNEEESSKGQIKAEEFDEAVMKIKNQYQETILDHETSLIVQRESISEKEARIN